MKYNVLGGGQLEATTDLGIIEAMRQDAQEWAPSADRQEYMNDLAARAMTQKGVIVRTDYINNFVADLRQYGFITPVEE